MSQKAKSHKPKETRETPDVTKGLERQKSVVQKRIQYAHIWAHQ